MRNLIARLGCLLACLAAWCAFLNPAAAGTLAADTLVLCPRDLQPPLAKWLAYREDQGHAILVAEPTATVAGVRQQIREVAAHSPLRFVMLVGGVPTAYAPARVNVRWGSEPEIATDGVYADLDDDGLPDVAIGRLPVRSPGELASVVGKIIRYEAAGHDLWRRRVSIVAGLGGFGFVADAALEAATRSLVGRGIPDGYQTHLTYASWQSPFCPPPLRFRESTLEGLSRGSLFWVYLGHGQRTLLDHVHVPGGKFPILSKIDIARLPPPRTGAGRSIALLVACYSGAFDSEDACLAEAMLSSAEGPVAVVAASRVTLPYGNAVLCSALMEECFTLRRPTLGELLLHAKRSSSAPRPEDPCRRALDLMAALLSPGPTDLAAERQEHALLYNLLGDPLLAIAHSQPVQLDAPATATAGEAIVIQGTSPLGGRCTLELVAERGQLTFSPPPRERYEVSDSAASEFADTYRRANDQRYVSRELTVAAGPFEAVLAIPRAARGNCYVRAFIAGQGEHAVGAAKMTIRGDSAD